MKMRARSLAMAFAGGAALLCASHPAAALELNLHSWLGKGVAEIRRSEAAWEPVTGRFQLAPGQAVRSREDSASYLQVENWGLLKLAGRSEIAYNSFYQRKREFILETSLVTGRLLVNQHNFNPERGSIFVKAGGAMVAVQMGLAAFEWDETAGTGSVILRSGRLCLDGYGKEGCLEGSGRLALPIKNGSVRFDPLDMSQFAWIDETYFAEYFNQLPEMLELIKPEIDAVTPTPEIVVSGHAKKGVRVWVDDLPIQVSETGGFKETLNLKEGTNYLTVVAEEFPGYDYSIIREVELDVRDPHLEIIAPPDNFQPDLQGNCYSGECYVDIIGFTEPGVQLYINGQKITHLIDPADGNFQINQYRLELTDEIIEFEAVDRAGRRTARQLRVGEMLDPNMDGIPDY